MDKWDTRFMQLCQLVASWSKDATTKVGSCIVDSRNRIVSVYRSQVDIESGRWTREQEDNFLHHAQIMGLRVRPVEWPESA